MPHTWSYQDLWKVVTKGPFVLRLTGAELLWLRFRTDPEVVRTVLPRPLRVPDDPLVTAFVARYPETNFGPSYREATVALEATYHGELGSYAIAMPVTDDMAMAGGREGSGYPKKMAEIELLSRGSHVHGRVARHGTEILRLEGELLEDTGTDPVGMGTETRGLDGEPTRKSVQWLFKYSTGVDGRPFQHSPLLVRQTVLFSPRNGQRRAALHLKLVSSPTDPLGDIPVVDLVDAGYGPFDIAMLPGRVVHKVRNPYGLVRKTLFRSDWPALMDFEAMPSHTFRERRRLGRKLSKY